MFDSFIILIALSIACFLAFSRRLTSSSAWKATVTPLASIMGSGFLISAPLLAGIVGNRAIIFMTILLVIAFLVGSVIRFNIKHFEPIEHRHKGIANDIALLSRIVLAGAYFISITYYLQLLSVFVLRIFNSNTDVTANILTTSILVFISTIGIWKGLDKLEIVEKYSIAINLGVIGTLILSLLIYNLRLFFDGNWRLPEISSSVNFADFRVLLGMLIIVQGFETSRYLGSEHPAAVRIKTMRNAQIISSMIYLLFIALATILFKTGIGSDVTAIINMTKPVAMVLPFMLTLAAIGSQFSAAVADESGSGELIEDLSNKKFEARYAYLLVLFITITITWASNVNEIIAYASRAFAFYYFLQCVVAFILSYQDREIKNRALNLSKFFFLALICLAVFILGIPSG